MGGESDVELSSSSSSNIYPPSIEEHEGIDKKKSSSRIGGLSHSVEVNPDLENESISREDSTELIQTTLSTVGTEFATLYEEPKTSSNESISHYSEHIPPSEKPKKKFHQKFGFSQVIPSLFGRKVGRDQRTKRHVPSLSMTTSSYSTPSIASPSSASSSSSSSSYSSPSIASSSSSSAASPSYSASSSSSSAASSSSSVASSPRAAAKTLKKLDKLTRLSQSKSKRHSKLTDGASVIKRALAAERILTNLINERLSLLDKDRPLSEQEAILRKVTKLINRLKDINVTLTELPRDFYLQSASDDIRTIAGKQIIRTHQPKDGSIDSEAETRFLERADISVIVNIMKIERSELGREFIHELAQSLTEKGHTLSIEAILKEGPSSLLAYIEGPPMNAMIGIHPGADLPKDPRLLAHAVDDVDSQLLVRRAGTSSALIFPTWSNTNPDDFDEIWRNNTTDEALGSILSGNFSFDNQSRMFYTPLHVEIAHELIHVLHNSRGMNAPEMELHSQSDFVLWHDFEEYMTITGGKFSENAIGAGFELPERHGHSGMAFSSLVNRNPKIMSKTPRQIEGITEGTHSHQHEG